MVDALLGPLVQKLGSLIETEFVLILGVKKDIEKLSSTLSTIRAVIEDAEGRQHTDKAIADWLKKLKAVAYDADDILDVWWTEVRLSESKLQTNSCAKQVSESSSCCFPFSQIAFRDNIANNVKEIVEKFDEIAGERSKFHLTEGVVEKGDMGRETSSVIAEPHVYGREEDKEKIVNTLINNMSSSNDVSVFSIVGIGGLGKTTLAQLVYNDRKLSNHFDVRIWVCVAEDFDVKRLLKLIIESLGGEATKPEASLDSLQSLLKTLLSGRRFLLVLDDVWNRDQDKWDKLKFSLTCGARGSSILVTTRLQEVALIMGGLSAYNLKPLSEDECWYLFKGRALGMGNDDLFPELVTIGQEIVQKCKGVPLAAKVLGTLLCFRREVSAWSSIRDNELWKLPEEEGGAILGVLRLSYNHLSPQHRQCFSYCSIYPKDHEMKKEELIQLWMANGFVQSGGHMELELDDVGNQIFNDLLQGSFFQNAQRDEFGNIVKCKMHDLMHDLACSLSLNECWVLDGDKKEIIIPNSMRHVSFVNVSWSPRYNSFCKFNKGLRTHLVIRGNYFGQSKKSFEMLKFLRVLDLSGRSSIERLPDSIVHMKCLRYLNLSYTRLRVLPESVCHLINLQSLKLAGCRKLRILPKDMRIMTSLRHLDISGCGKLCSMPIEMGQMVRLRTLSKFVVGQKSGHRISELNGLNHLRGELCIVGLEHVKNMREAKEANLVGKQNLCSLGIFWEKLQKEEEEEEEKEKSEVVIECLQPHPNLKKLVISGYKGKLPPSWMKVLLNLVEIRLDNCKRLQIVPPLGHLPVLKILKLSGLDGLKCIGTEFYGSGEGSRKGFPSLEKLVVESMSNLEELKVPFLSEEDGGDDDDVKDGAFPSLSEFSIGECPKLKTLSLRNLSRLSSIVIDDLPELVSFPKGFLQNLTAVEKLSIRFVRKLKSIPTDAIENLTGLKSLVISDCEELISLPAEGLQKLTSLNLNSFTISSCNSLKTLPAMGRMIQEGMTMKSSCCSLVSLDINRCHGITSVSEGLRYLSSLETLEIEDCRELELKREDFQHLTSLRHLTLTCLPKLISVPDVQNLTSLETVEIRGCYELELKREDFQHLTCLRHLTLGWLPKLISVPDVQNLTALQSLKLEEDYNLRILPEGVQQHLSSLQTLQVRRCHPDLHKRLKRGKGVDWPTISHIPKLHIDP